MTIHVTAHAIQRYQERVAPVSAAEAHKALSTRAIQASAEFVGNQTAYVRLPTGQRVVIKDRIVVTVQPAEHFRRQIHRRGLGRFGKSSSPSGGLRNGTEA